jgi:hypothetical protein|tara:strand:- start:89 stop:343 length:255 start_codon:yes stop_codon:yes gene_type:complete
LNVILNIADDHLPKITTNQIGESVTFNFNVIYKVKKNYPLWSETAFLPGQIDSYGLWNVSEELASIKDIDKEFQGTLYLGRFIR